MRDLNHSGRKRSWIIEKWTVEPPTPRTELLGQLTAACSVQVQGRNVLLGVRFQPHAAGLFLRSSVASLSNAITDLADVFSADTPCLQQQLLDLIRERPTSTPEELARSMGMSRAAVNVYVGHLTRKGALLGRGYLLPPGRSGVVVVGGANMDIKAQVTGELMGATSHPGRTSQAPGGVARNVAENLARLGVATRLITAVGQDPAGTDGGWRLLRSVTQPTHGGGRGDGRILPGCATGARRPGPPAHRRAPPLSGPHRHRRRAATDPCRRNRTCSSECLGRPAPARRGWRRRRPPCAS